MKKTQLGYTKQVTYFLSVLLHPTTSSRVMFVIKRCYNPEIEIPPNNIIPENMAVVIHRDFEWFLSDTCRYDTVSTRVWLHAVGAEVFIGGVA